ncbi:MerR family transcriptional regulator [Bifidobacterium sp. MA2]|uniref:MerR family transcriptional regulator n=1 Tax=Bifidobacterium santillanense TaxID=2809028 RepID=A0ABS5UM99_9BIFI|nr:MerR family transcriptional regulator [Bifidobacterium santillanense]MBT1172021.1 MerR family transcriptional regulator [Bifidobacterium santillanense]
MGYSIGQVSRRTGLSEHTLRYYDREGLLPSLARTGSGRRCFDDGDIELLDLIECLKSTGMSLAEIRDFVDMTTKGDATLADRLAVFRRQRAVVERRIEDLRRRWSKLDYKVRYFEAAVEAGSESLVEGDCEHPEHPIRIIAG